MQPMSVSTPLSPVPPAWRHQAEAMEFILEHWSDGYPGVLLAFFMGLGKTKVAIDLIHRLNLATVLIACPRPVVDVWRVQLEKHARFDYVLALLDERAGSVKDKARKARDTLALARARHVPALVVVNYDAIWLEPFASWALATFWSLVICDELHRAKSASGKMSRYLGRLGKRALRRLGLTGTPIAHSILDVWAQFRFLDPRIFDETYTSFVQRYAILGGFERREVTGWRDLDDFERRMATITFQAGKELLDLPPEMDEHLYCDLTSAGARLYRQLEDEFMAWIGETPDELLTVANAMVLLVRLQQLTGGTLKDDRERERTVDTAKESLLEEWLEDLPPDEPAVVYCRFTADIEACARACERAGRPYSRMSGHARAGAREWLAQPNGILLAQIQMASEGQDFTRARYSLFYSLGWSLKDYLQARARVHRPGQTLPTTHYHLIARGTVDEIVLRAVHNRWQMAETVLKEMKEKHVQRTRPL
jgi:SNF2 family DNA or RNA helicase